MEYSLTDIGKLPQGLLRWSLAALYGYPAFLFARAVLDEPLSEFLAACYVKNVLRCHFYWNLCIDIPYREALPLPRQ